jgi:hypothetical protein
MSLGYLFRMEGGIYDCEYDEFGNRREMPVKDQQAWSRIDKYPIIKRTKKGAWIEYEKAKSGKKFVGFTTNKQFACETDGEALHSYIMRKQAQIKILGKRLEESELLLAKARGELDKPGMSLPPTERAKPAVNPRNDDFDDWLKDI